MLDNERNLNKKGLAFNRRTLLRGALGLGVTAAAEFVPAPIVQLLRVEPSSAEAQESAYNYKKISEAPEDEWFNVTTENGQNWSGAVQLRKPSGVPGQLVADAGIYGEVSLLRAGNPEVGLGIDVMVNAKDMASLRGNGVRGVIRVEGAGQVLLMNERLEVATAVPTADNKTAVYIPEEDGATFGIRILGERAKLSFGGISQDEFGRIPGVDAAAHWRATFQPQQPEPAPVQQAPRILRPGEMPTYTRIHDIESGVWVYPAGGQTGEKRWGADTQINLYEGTQAFDADETDSIRLSSNGRPLRLALFSQWLPNMNVIRLGGQGDQRGRYKAIWLREFQGNSRVTMFLNNDRGVYPAANFSVDGGGFGGVLLPSQNLQFELEMDDQRGKAGKLTSGSISEKDFRENLPNAAVYPLYDHFS